MPKICRYEVYRTAPTLHIVRHSSVIEQREDEYLPNICKHWRQDMVGNEAPSILSKISMSD